VANVFGVLKGWKRFWTTGLTVSNPSPLTASLLVRNEKPCDWYRLGGMATVVPGLMIRVFGPPPKSLPLSRTSSHVTCRDPLDCGCGAVLTAPPMAVWNAFSDEAA